MVALNQVNYYLLSDLHGFIPVVMKGQCISKAGGRPVPQARWDLPAPAALQLLRRKEDAGSLPPVRPSFASCLSLCFPGSLSPVYECSDILSLLFCIRRDGIQSQIWGRPPCLRNRMSWKTATLELWPFHRTYTIAEVQVVPGVSWSSWD